MEVRRVNYDKAFDIYGDFGVQTRKNNHFESRPRCDEIGNERICLKFDCGFTVELTNNKNVENSAVLRCWWKDEEPIEVESLEQLFLEFAKYSN